MPWEEISLICLVDHKKHQADQLFKQLQEQGWFCWSKLVAIFLLVDAPKIGGKYQCHN